MQMYAWKAPNSVRPVPDLVRNVTKDDYLGYILIVVQDLSSCQAFFGIQKVNSKRLCGKVHKNGSCL